MKGGAFSLLEAAARFSAFAENTKIAKQVTLAEIAIMIRDEAKAAIGTYKFRWPHLAESTQEDRLRKGFSEDEPGLRTGEMRESIEAKIVVDEELRQTCLVRAGDSEPATQERFINGRSEKA